MSSYQRIKNFIFGKLQDKQTEIGILETDDIEKEISNTKDLIEKLGIETFAQLLSAESLSNLSNEDFDRMKKELETHFDVKMKEGILIQGEEQQNRDTTWWTGEKKQKTDTYYWGRYKKYLKKSLPDDVIRTIDTDTDIVMNNIENPDIDTFNRYGMVVGHVQSGKTANYSSLICKAADAGYKFIVVIAGGINNLRNQTQERINESFIGRDNNGNQVGAGKGNSTLDKLPISLTTVERDFNNQDADRNSQGSNFDNTSTPIVLVIKKNTSTLKNVIKWLESQYKNKIDKHAMLMIDDESDYASINTKEEEDPTAINIKLRKLLSLFNKSCYVAYTATPYANIFINHEAGHVEVGRDLFPKDFIYSLDAPSNYFGARKIFLDSNQKHLIEIDDYLDDIPEKHPKDFPLLSIPESLYEAMRMFLLNIAIRTFRGQGNQHNSMLIHATMFTLVHQRFALHAESYIEDIKRDIDAYGKLPNATQLSPLINIVKNTFDNRNDIKNKPTWSEVLDTLCDIIGSVVVREVHQSTSVPLEYRKDRVTNAIVVGGTSVARGFTLEGLSVSYFLRNTVFYDTLMQMGRWFGYRTNYEDLCKIYMSDTMIDNFARIIEATEDLIQDFKLMSEAKKTPNDFGLAVKQHPDSALQVTARNKQKNVQEFIFNMKLDGQSKETSWLSNNNEDKKDNLRTIESIVKVLNKNYTKEVIGNDIFWRDIRKNIIIDFLNQFKVYQTDALGISARMPIAFVKKYAETRNVDWDIALYSGKGTEENIDTVFFKREGRKAEIKHDYIEIQNRQVSTGNSESISLNAKIRKELGSNRKKIRQRLTKPLLMLHILETPVDKRLAAFGVSFPGDVLSKQETINLKINTVYYKNLLEELNLESKSDD
ncbi:MAG: Z1 domain-containing protein [Sulfurovaceae bacterium]|nr:Z1 domain-containing protein [Sulfurovaceae bacterium]